MKGSRVKQIKERIALLQPDERIRLITFMERFCPVCGRVRGLWSHMCEDDHLSAAKAAAERAAGGGK